MPPGRFKVLARPRPVGLQPLQFPEHGPVPDHEVLPVDRSSRRNGLVEFEAGAVVPVDERVGVVRQSGVGHQRDRPARVHACDGPVAGLWVAEVGDREIALVGDHEELEVLRVCGGKQLLFDPLRGRFKVQRHGRPHAERRRVLLFHVEHAARAQDRELELAAGPAVRRVAQVSLCHDPVPRVPHPDNAPAPPTPAQPEQNQPHLLPEAHPVGVAPSDGAEPAVPALVIHIARTPAGVAA
eukprot:801740-Rhodomonas_salina.1